MDKRKIAIIAGLFIIAIAVLFFAFPWLFLGIAMYANTASLSAQAPSVYNDSCIAHCLPTHEMDAIWIDYPDTDNHSEMMENIINDVKNIYFLNLTDSKGAKTAILPNFSDIELLARDGNRIVWTEGAGFGKRNGTMYLKDITTGSETRLLSTFDAKKLAFSGSNIIFSETRKEGYGAGIDADEIYLYDLNAGTKTLLIGTTGLRPCIGLYGNNLVYTELGDRYTRYTTPEHADTEAITVINIYLYHLDRRTKEKIAGIETASEADMFLCPSIYKDKIAYGKENAIYLYDTNTGGTTQIATLKPVFKDNAGSLKSIQLHDNEIKYLQAAGTWIGMDMDATYYKCTSMDINSKKEKDITCHGGTLGGW